MKTNNINNNKEKYLVVRALRTTQKKGIDTFSFFLPGSKLIDIANISRIKRDVNESLVGRGNINTTNILRKQQTKIYNIYFSKPAIII